MKVMEDLGSIGPVAEPKEDVAVTDMDLLVAFLVLDFSLLLGQSGLKVRYS